MDHVNFPNHDEDQERDQHYHENDRVRPHYVRTERAIWVQRDSRMPPQGQLYNSHLALPPGNLSISRHAAPAYQQDISRCMVRPPPIGVSIPIIYWSSGDTIMDIRNPLLFNLVQNPLSFYQRLLRIRNIPPSMLLQLRSQNCLSFQFFMRRQSNRYRNRIPRSTYPHRPRRPAIKRASYYLRSSKSRQRLNQGQCIMNDVNSEITVDSPQQAKETEEEKDHDDKGEPSDKCEAYKDLYYDKDSDDDDDDFNSNNQAFSNMQILF